MEILARIVSLEPGTHDVTGIPRKLGSGPGSLGVTGSTWPLLLDRSAPSEHRWLEPSIPSPTLPLRKVRGSSRAEERKLHFSVEFIPFFNGSSLSLKCAFSLYAHSPMRFENI